jgi:hypothetical protein
MYKMSCIIVIATAASAMADGSDQSSNDRTPSTNQTASTAWVLQATPYANPHNAIQAAPVPVYFAQARDWRDARMHGNDLSTTQTQPYALKGDTAPLMLPLGNPPSTYRVTQPPPANPPMSIDRSSEAQPNALKGDDVVADTSNVSTVTTVIWEATLPGGQSSTPQRIQRVRETQSFGLKGEVVTREYIR